MERKWVIAAFLDITGFRSWTYRAATSPEMKEEFLRSFYGILQCYVRSNLSAWAKYEGDGILIIHEFTPEERKKVFPVRDFVLSLRHLFQKAKRTILNADGGPDGVRIRLIGGHVYKIMVVDPNDSQRQKMIPEYVEYCTNTARGLLEVNPEISCLATKGLVKADWKARPVLRVRPLGKPSIYPKGVNREDIDGLEIVNF